MFSPVWYPVPPTAYGGTEMIVALLTEGLLRRGIDVTVFASGDSTTTAPLVSVYDAAPSERIGETFWELRHALAFLTRSADFDLVHDHSGLLGLTLFGLTRVPLLHTVHGSLTGQAGAMYRDACAVVSDTRLVSLTLRQRRPRPNLPWIANVPNAIELERFPFDRDPSDSLLFLGRMTPEKGAHRAIEVARLTGRPLRIAAKCREPAEQAYFDSQVRPHLGPEIEYVGEADHALKCELLRTAHALLVPIDWEEPFGLVMAEALACGTPVIAFRRGSVPELLDHGRTGLLASDLDEMAACVDKASLLDPYVLRQEAEKRFTVERMVDEYIGAYTKLLGGRALAPAPAFAALPLAASS
jgi:glycosyltransferase involved in cell wall biosynthesis